jgi:tetratricopeptide (TPR) repeat protein
MEFEFRPLEDEYTLLHRLETKLRQLIETKLSALSDYWWEERVPWKVRDRVMKRKKRKRLAPWFKAKHVNLPEVYYLGLGDYGEIINQPSNWKTVFKTIFHDKDFIIKRLNVLRKLRDDVMHAQPLTEKEKMVLEKYTEDIIKRLEDWDVINDRYVHKAQEALIVGKTDKALALLKEGLKRTTTNDRPRGDPWIAFWMGRVFEELKNYDEAKNWYRYASETLVLPNYRKIARDKLHEIDKKVEIR